MDKPRLLDLYCGAGGAAKGYSDAGFEVVGIDILPQPHYPFEFIEGNVMELTLEFLKWFDVIHASPPCKTHTILNKVHKNTYPDLIAPTRILLEQTRLPYVIENVPGSPLIDPIQLCGGYFGLGIEGYYLKRHRLFESTLALEGTPCNHFEKYAIGVYGHGPWDNRGLGRGRGGYTGTAAEKAEAMGIDWMNRDELSQAIPPLYTYYLGLQIMRQIL